MQIESHDEEELKPLIGSNYTYVTSLGSNCYASALIERLDLKRAPMPFDWLSSTLPMVEHCIASDFQQLLDKQYYKPVERDGQLQFKHTFYDTHWYTNFNHYDPRDGMGRIYLLRCVDRWRDMMASDHPKLFLFVSQIFDHERDRYVDEFRSLEKTISGLTRNATIIGITSATNGQPPGFMQACRANESRLFHYTARAPISGTLFELAEDEARITALVKWFQTNTTDFLPSEPSSTAEAMEDHDADSQPGDLSPSEKTVEPALSTIPLPRLSHMITHLGTVVYYCTETKKIRHVFPDSAPRNLVLLADGRLVYVSESKKRAWMYDDRLDENALYEAVSSSGEVICACENIEFDGQFIGLKEGQRFFSASPGGEIAFAAPRMQMWEQFTWCPLPAKHIPWRPRSPMGGTQVVAAVLKQHVGNLVDKINLCLNRPYLDAAHGRPTVVWVYNETGHEFYTWMFDTALVSAVARFVFASNWQMQTFVDYYKIPANKCTVLKSAIIIDPARKIRKWSTAKPWRIRCAYISNPNRGLDILLEAWKILAHPYAELNIWSSERLYLYRPELSHAENQMVNTARDTQNVIYHDILPNKSLRHALEDMHYLIYPSTIRETSCVAAIDAMAAGCRLIVPCSAVLPETTAGFAKLYPLIEDKTEHAHLLAKTIEEEFSWPWAGQPGMAELQQLYCNEVYGWEGRTKEWTQMINSLIGNI